MDAIAVDNTMTDKKASKLILIFKRNRDKLVGFIQKRIQDFEVAEDITQDIFYKLTNVIDTVESVDAWMYTVARNQIKDYYKKKKEQSINEYVNEDDEFQLPALVADISNMPDSLFTREAVWEELEHSLEELPALQREVFVMHELENFSIKQIAEFQNTSTNTVLSRKRYAVSFLREQLNDFYKELNI